MCVWGGGGGLGVEEGGIEAPRQLRVRCNLLEDPLRRSQTFRKFPGLNQ